MSKEYILKQNNGNNLLFILRDDILELEFIPSHKEPRLSFSAPRVVNFRSLSEEYDVEKDENAILIPDRYYLVTIHRSYTLEKKEYEDIKRWIMEGQG